MAKNKYTFEMSVAIYCLSIVGDARFWPLRRHTNRRKNAEMIPSYDLNNVELV